MEWVDTESESMNELEISVGVAQDAEDHALPVVVVTLNDTVVEIPDLEMATAIAMNLLEAVGFAATVVEEAPDHTPASIFAAMQLVQSRAGRKMN
jgi:hypothetical protein